MKTILLPADNFVVLNKSILTEYDKKLIFNLYQPIIGTTATSLYFSLWAYLDKSEIFSIEWSHHNLMTNTKLNLDDIISAREKLEGIGLLKTYYKPSNINNYIYELYSPLNSYEFFNNPILSTTLKSNIGQQEFEKLINYYSLPKFNLTEYENITCSFNDVYDVIQSPNLNFYDNLKTAQKNNLVLNDKININEILSLIPEDLLDIKKINKETKDIVIKLTYIYNFTNEQMQNIIINSIEDKKINIDILKHNCEVFYKFENNGNLPSIIYKKQPDYLKKEVKSTSKKSKIIYQFENISPFEFLVSKNKGVKPTTQELNLVSYLLVDLKMMPGVVNVLIDYVLRINENKLTRQFVESIASQWVKSNVKTVEEAMKLAEKEHKKRTKINETKTIKKQIEKPDWYEKNITVNETTDKEKENLENLLSRFK